MSHDKRARKRQRQRAEKRALGRLSKRLAGEHGRAVITATQRENETIVLATALAVCLERLGLEEIEVTPDDLTRIVGAIETHPREGGGIVLRQHRPRPEPTIPIDPDAAITRDRGDVGGATT